MTPAQEKAHRAIIRNAKIASGINAALAENGVGLVCVHYTSAAEPAFFKCQAGHVFEARTGHARAGKAPCPVCRADRRHEKAPSEATLAQLEAARETAQIVAELAAVAAEDFAGRLEKARVAILIADNKKAIAQRDRRVTKNAGVFAPAEKKSRTKSKTGREQDNPRPANGMLKQHHVDVLAALELTLAQPNLVRLSDPAPFVCAEGHQFEASVSRMVSIGRGCPLCDGSLEDVLCAGCGQVSRLPAKRLRFEAARLSVKKATYVSPIATCCNCGADLHIAARRQTPPSEAHLARVAAADQIRDAAKLVDYASAMEAYAAILAAQPHQGLFMSPPEPPRLSAAKQKPPRRA